MLCVEIRIDDHLYIPTYAHRLYKIMLFINMCPSTCFSINRHSEGEVNTKEYMYHYVSLTCTTLKAHTSSCKYNNMVIMVSMILTYS